RGFSREQPSRPKKWGSNGVPVAASRLFDDISQRQGARVSLLLFGRPRGSHYPSRKELKGGLARRGAAPHVCGPYASPREAHPLYGASAQKNGARDAVCPLSISPRHSERALESREVGRNLTKKGQSFRIVLQKHEVEDAYV